MSMKTPLQSFRQYPDFPRPRSTPFKFLGRFLVLLSWIFLTTCSKAPQDQDIYLFVFENLPLDLVDCSTANPFPSVSEILCQEFVRFSHAFTPSSSPEVAMASLLTGLSPKALNFQDPRIHFLKSTFTTFVEPLLTSHSTAFWVGGPPLTRRHNLHQGFEVFDDQFPVQSEALGKSFSQLLKSHQAWQNQIQKKSELSIFFISHLQKSELVFQELDGFFRELKKKKKWVKSEIIVTGLRGQTGPESDLRGRHMQVGLFWKRPHPNREQGLAFQRDENVSLADIEASFLTRFNIPPENDELAGTTLDPLLDRLENKLETDRIITSESASGFQALRIGEWLYLSEDSGEYFHSLTDRAELTPLPADESSLRYVQEKLRNLRKISGPRNSLQAGVSSSQGPSVSSATLFFDRKMKELRRLALSRKDLLLLNLSEKYLELSNPTKTSSPSLKLRFKLDPCLRTDSELASCSHLELRKLLQQKMQDREQDRRSLQRTWS
ncbi:MAG: hypothetical protein WCH11_07785, partial [Bdellovibrio sp.]